MVEAYNLLDNMSGNTLYIKWNFKYGNIEGRNYFTNTVSVEILKDLYYMGVNDRDTNLFENMWPLPEGVEYNS